MREPEKLGLAATCLLAALGTDDRYETDEEIARSYVGALMIVEALRDLHESAADIRILRSTYVKTK